MGWKKLDNASLPKKIALRKWLLGRMGLSEICVLDTCAGLGIVWGAMEEHVTIRQWTRCDIKPRRAGTLAIEATEAIRRFNIDDYNVIDIDPYGEPWVPYLALLGRLSRPTAVFLTHGHVSYSSLSKAGLAAIGIPAAWPAPKVRSLMAYASDQILAQTWNTASIIHAGKLEAAHATYYALGLRPYCVDSRQDRVIQSAIKQPALARRPRAPQEGATNG